MYSDSVSNTLLLLYVTTPPWWNIKPSPRLSDFKMKSCMKGCPSTSWKAGIAKQWIHKTKSIHLQYVPYTTITPLAKPKIIAKVCLNRKGILKEKKHLLILFASWTTTASTRLSRSGKRVAHKGSGDFRHSLWADGRTDHGEGRPERQQSLLTIIFEHVTWGRTAPGMSNWHWHVETCFGMFLFLKTSLFETSNSNHASTG